MNTTYLLIGSNLGDRHKMLTDAIQEIDASTGTVSKRSGVYETAAWGNEQQQPFLNAALEVATEKGAVDFLYSLQAIEKKLGRHRAEKWGPRLIDIDILFFNAEVWQTDELVVPHPYMAIRRFTLEPLAEIAGGLVHPVLHKTVAQMLDACPDKLPVRMLNKVLL